MPVVSRGYERPQHLSERQSRGETEGTTLDARYAGILGYFD